MRSVLALESCPLSARREVASLVIALRLAPLNSRGIDDLAFVRPRVTMSISCCNCLAARSPKGLSISMPCANCMA